MNAPAPAGSVWTIEHAERYLLSLELFGMRFGLDRMHRLMTALDLPEQRFDSIHVVGTNGKSSTVRLIAAILQRHGLLTGAYLSPHLVSFTERLRVDDEDVSDDAFSAAIARAAHAARLVNRTLSGPGDQVTQFEALTAAAYSELARQQVDVAVVEAGLGGRYDATSVVRAPVTVLTNVGLEHTRWLGPTITDIAREKLEVLEHGGTLVLGPDLDPAATEVAEELAQARGAEIVWADPAQGQDGLTMLAQGRFQRLNFALALAASDAYLRTRIGAGIALDRHAVQMAAASTMVPGRFQLVAGDPPTLLDGAHNPGGMAALADSLPEFLRGRELHAVVSILDDKDAGAMLATLLPHCCRVVFCSCSNPRALSPATLGSLAGQLSGPDVEIEPDPRRALEMARLAAPDGVVLATGSIYLIADLLRPPGGRRASML